MRRSYDAGSRSPEGGLQGGEVCGKRAFEEHGLAREGVLEAQFAGMERLAAKGGKGALSLRRKLGFAGKLAAAIDGIAQERVALMGQVDADLVGAPGFQPANKAGDDGFRRTIAFGDMIMGNRLAPILADSHFLAVLLAATQGGIDGALVRIRLAPDEGDIGAGEAPVAAMGGELFLQVLQGAFCLGGDEKAAGVLVDAVDDAGPPRPGCLRNGRAGR